MENLAPKFLMAGISAALAYINILAYLFVIPAVWMAVFGYWQPLAITTVVIGMSALVVFGIVKFLADDLKPLWIGLALGGMALMLTPNKWDILVNLFPKN